ncbi:hypothetical protein SFUL_5529 [Streptomyces microflavus DSM 40593]|uniref:Uncharacterized protein n=1 Tax=Streptomyces microflavus DSM 40593 TaxID=1303692 RepID=N0D514_STRMI|nr:hypothetical protein [Streptomyces microflavus]AGK80417.1 hypothetical protein SFUL_5529 [Streptomyces microflavus DSM 40593]
MRLFRLALAIASSALAFSAAAEGDTFAAVCWTVVTVRIVMNASAEDSR